MAPNKLCVFVDENYDKLPTLYWLPKHINLVLLLILTIDKSTIKNHVIKCCEKVSERNG